MITQDKRSTGYLLAIICGIALPGIFMILIIVILMRHRILNQLRSGLHISSSMDSSRHEDEKSNNLQNEENFRRYANPLKGSATSLRGAMELNLSPGAEMVSTLAGPSALHRSQPLYPPCDHEKDPDIKLATHRSSQILLYKAQNSDMRKNIVGSLESPHKDFGKRSINCQSVPPSSDVLTVHV